jgi:hypothetical protein
MEALLLHILPLPPYYGSLAASHPPPSPHIMEAWLLHIPPPLALLNAAKVYSYT